MSSINEIANAAVAADLNLAVVEQRKAYIASLSVSVMKAAANGIGKERFEAMCLATLAKNPGIANCERGSVALAFRKCAELGLYPGSALNHVALIPYGKDLQVIVQYQGLVALAQRNPDIASINTIVVYKTMDYRLLWGDDGLKLELQYEPEKIPDVSLINKDNASDYIAGTYAVITTKSGARYAEFCPISEIEMRRKRGASGKGKRTPWETDYVAMARKSGLRKLLLGGLVPLSLDAADALDVEEPDFEVQADAADATPKPTGKPAGKRAAVFAKNQETPAITDAITDATIIEDEPAQGAEAEHAMAAGQGPQGDL